MTAVPWRFSTDRIELVFVGQLFHRDLRQVDVTHDAGKVTATVRFRQNASIDADLSNHIELDLTSSKPGGFDVIDPESAARVMALGSEWLAERDVHTAIARLVRSIHVGLEAAARRVEGRTP